eukprot:Gb_30984 [translate_table: standard]
MRVRPSFTPRIPSSRAFIYCNGEWGITGGERGARSEARTGGAGEHAQGVEGGGTRVGQVGSRDGSVHGERRVRVGHSASKKQGACAGKGYAPVANLPRVRTSSF